MLNPPQPSASGQYLLGERRTGSQVSGEDFHILEELAKRDGGRVYRLWEKFRPDAEPIQLENTDAVSQFNTSWGSRIVAFARSREESVDLVVKIQAIPDQSGLHALFFIQHGNKARVKRSSAQRRTNATTPEGHAGLNHGTMGVDDVLNIKSHTLATLLATMTSLDFLQSYSELLLAPHESGTELVHPELKAPLTLREAEQKLADRHERRGYRLVCDGVTVVGYASLMRLRYGDGASHVSSIRRGGKDPQLASGASGTMPGIFDGFLPALCLDPSYRAMSKGRRHIPIYRLDLTRAVMEIVTAYAEVNQFILRLWAKPWHPDEIEFFRKMAKNFPGTVQEHSGDPPAFMVQIWPDGLIAGIEPFPTAHRLFTANASTITRLLATSAASGSLDLVVRPPQSSREKRTPS